MKNFLKVLIIGILLFGVSNGYANSNNLIIDKAQENILSIKNGDKFQVTIDKYIANNINDVKLLNSLNSQLEKYLLEFNKKNDEISNKISIIFTYFELKIKLALNIDIKDEIIDDSTVEINKSVDDEGDITNQEDTEVSNNTENKDTLYLGFTNEYNDNDKIILAGTSDFIFKQSYTSLYEASDIGKVIVYIESSDADKLKSSISGLTLYLEGSLLETTNNGDIDVLSSKLLKVTFDNVNDLIITENSRELRVGIITHNIGYQKLGDYLNDAFVSKLGFDDIIGLSSGRKLDAYDVTEQSEKFSISPGILKLNVKKNLSSNIPEINIKALFDENSVSSDNSSPTILLNTITLSTLGSSNIDDATFTLYNSERSADNVVGVVKGNNVDFDLSTLIEQHRTISNSNSGEDFKISINGTNSNSTLVLSLIKNGLSYSVTGYGENNNFNIELLQDLDLGTKQY